jgi:hypothetical protein
MVDKGVKLGSNGEYWQACFYDSSGRRKKKSLGPKSEMSKTAARRECAEIAEQLARDPGRREAGQAPQLGPWLDEKYLPLRTNLADRSMDKQKCVVRRLKACYGAETRMDRITRERAEEFRVWCSKLTKQDKKTPVGEFAVLGNLIIAREIFGRAHKLDLIPFNPFDRMDMETPEFEKEWPYITYADTDKVMECATSEAWRCLIALARLGGLRRGEALRQCWSDINWQTRRLTVKPARGKKDTKNRLRVVPMTPRLYEVLWAAWNEAPEGAVKPCEGINPEHIEETVRRFVASAGVRPWDDKPLQTLRKNLETDWLDVHPFLSVCEWLGNSPEVAAKHYNKTKDSTIDRVTGKAPSEIEQLRAELAAAKAELATLKTKIAQEATWSLPGSSLNSGTSR